MTDIVFFAYFDNRSFNCWLKNKVTIHYITRAGGIVIQNDGKQDVSQQLQGWIHVCFES